jgi:signal transduction histidine kinase
VPVDASLLGRVLRSRRAARLSDIGPRADFNSAGTAALGSLIVPLVFRDRAYGLLAAIDPAKRSEFSSEDERLLVAFATSAASAIATARSYEQGLLRRSIHATEVERGRWATQLRKLTLARLVETRAQLAQAHASGAHDDLVAATEHALGELGDQIDALQWMIAQPRPPQLDGAGIKASLEALFQRADLIGLVVDCEIDLADESGGAAERLDSAVEVTLFRVVQEALDNAARHGGANSAHVALQESDDELVLCVRDEGRGFDPAVETDGYGFVDMRERLALVGGALDVRSEPGSGTTITARIPAPRREA